MFFIIDDNIVDSFVFFFFCHIFSISKIMDQFLNLGKWSPKFILDVFKEKPKNKSSNQKHEKSDFFKKSDF
ncbi:hypothetical protein BGP_4340 [Beggiatoa sp. PS]|nr:hypothetical protein BGP_4340 [Beggiatoa sp. PS]